MSDSPPIRRAALARRRPGPPHVRPTRCWPRLLPSVAGPVRPAAHEDLYLALLRAIVSQQISTKAAAAIWRRFTALFRPDGYPEPREVLRLSEDELREAGLSRQKAGYLHAIADYQERGLLDYEHLSQLDEEAFTAHLTAIKGVGRWTAQMLQMFALDQPDVFSEGDLGVQNAMRKLYNLERNRPGPAPENAAAGRALAALPLAGLQVFMAHPRRPPAS